MATASRGGGDVQKPDMLPERFVGLDDVVAKEFADLKYPWDLAAIEERISRYSAFSEKINAQLSARVMANYNDFVQGMQQVQSVETELTLIGVLIKNGRRKLQERDLGLTQGSMRVSRQHKKSQRLKSLLAALSEFQDVVQLHTRLGECLTAESYCEAIEQHAALREALTADKFRKFPGLAGLREGLNSHVVLLQQKLSDGLRVAAVSADFDAERYEEILKAYSMMPNEQALSVGKELLRHVSECIVVVSRQCMLMFSPDAAQESPADWMRKAQLRDLCRSMDPTHFVDCTAKLYEHLCDFLYRHQFLCRWHEYRAQGAEAEDDKGSARFREILRDVQNELVASKRNVWHHISQQVSLVLMTLEFQYPALSEESFLHILHLTQMLIDEGDAFMADYPAATRSAGASSSAASAESRRQWSAPIKNTLKSKANDYFQSLHTNAWVSLKMDCIEKEDSWQRLPVARSYQLIQKERLQVHSRRDSTLTTAAAGAAGKGDAAGAKVRTSETNPFRNYKPEPLASPAMDGDGAGGRFDSLGRDESLDDIDEHALLQHWIDDNESLAPEHIGSAMLSNSNRSPVVSKATVELARLLERYFRMMGAIPQLALDIFASAGQLIEFYVYCVLCLFVQDRHLRAFLEELDLGPQPQNPDARLQQRHEALLMQRMCPELRRAAVRSRESMSAVRLPDASAAQAGGGGVTFLQVTPFPKLNSPSSLCGVAERCTGAESVFALLADLRELTPTLAERLPKGEQEAVQRFVASQEVVATQLRSFVLRCAASDVLEVPQMGRVSLDHFSNTMQALKWEARDFSQGSPGAPYMEQLRAQIDELARRIPSAGGGSIPYATQRLVWGWMEARIIQECVEVIAKCGRKKSQEALICLAEDFQTLRAAVQQNFKSAPGDGKEEELQLLPADNPLHMTTCWEYLDKYLEAHGYLPTEIVAWCRGHMEYPLRVHKALIEYLQSNPKAQRQALIDVESFLIDYIAQSATELSSSAGGDGPGGRRAL